MWATLGVLPASVNGATAHGVLEMSRASLRRWYECSVFIVFLRIPKANSWSQSDALAKWATMLSLHDTPLNAWAIDFIHMTSIQLRDPQRSCAARLALRRKLGNSTDAWETEAGRRRMR